MFIVYLIEQDKLSDENDHSLDRVYHQTVKKVTDDFESLGFNTAISQMMILSMNVIKRQQYIKNMHSTSLKCFLCIAASRL